MSSKDRFVFRLVPESEFGEEHFADYPVWAELDEYGDIEEMVRCGIDADWLAKEVEEHHHGSHHAMYPLLRTDPFPFSTGIFIKARLETPSGRKLSGYLINEEPYAIGIFSSGHEYIFNIHLGSNDFQEQREALRRDLGDPDDLILPLRYETDFTDQHGRPIEGFFPRVNPTTPPPAAR